MDKLLIVVPCYNEEKALPISLPKLLGVIEEMAGEGLISPESGLVLVNDGSRDRTWDIIREAAEAHKNVTGIDLAANVGHQNALFAGLEYAVGRCGVCVSIDADLQDDVGVMRDMVKKYLGGTDIVFGVREDRSSDTFFKRSTAQGFYRLMNAMGVRTVYNHADYRLMSDRALEALMEYREQNLFLRGIVAGPGFNTAQVTYSRKRRVAGKSKYSLRRMLAFAWEGITSFSIKPMSFLAALGFGIIICTLLAVIYTLVSKIVGHTIPGWTSLMLSIWFLGGVQLLSLGVIGQYVGKTYIESKQRPKYFIKEIISHEDK